MYAKKLVGQKNYSPKMQKVRKNAKKESRNKFTIINYNLYTILCPKVVRVQSRIVFFFYDFKYKFILDNNY